MAMSAIGTKQTWASALQMSAFGGKADIVSGSSPACFHCPYCYTSDHNCNSLLRTPVENHGKYSTRDLCPKVSKCNS